MDSIHPYDILMLILLVGTTVFGAWKGMAWQIASLGSLVLSCFVALRFAPALAPTISNVEPWNYFLAMLVLFVGTSLTVWIAFRMVAGIIDRVRLREFDRQIGALFGLAKGIALCVVVTFFATTLSEGGRQAVLNAKSGKYIALLIKNTGSVMPDRVRPYLEELDRRLDPALPSSETSTAESKIREAGSTANRTIQEVVAKPLEGILPQQTPPVVENAWRDPVSPMVETVLEEHVRPAVRSAWDDAWETRIEPGLQDALQDRVQPMIEETLADPSRIEEAIDSLAPLVPLRPSSSDQESTASRPWWEPLRPE